MNVLGIYREPAYSPGRHASNDGIILRLVGHALERLGATVRLAELEEARTLRRQVDLIFSMCQGPEAIAEIASWKAEGALILNDPDASRRTYRDYLCASVHEEALGFPHSEFLATDIYPGELERYRRWFADPAHKGAWLKRADVHATQTSDVMRLEKWPDLNAALTAFRLRGLQRAVLQRHCAGDEVKFYAVRGGRFFWPFYPRECAGHPFDQKQLQDLSERASEHLGISIYGGDAIIAPDGRLTLIDLNDWPSFAPCRGAAAHAIARYLKDCFHAHKEQTLSL